MKTLIAALALLGLVAAAPAQAKDVATWEMLAITARVPEVMGGRLRVHADVHARRTDAHFQSLIRPGLAFDLAPGLSAWAGYTYVPLWVPVGPNHHQQDVWQQLQYGAHLDAVNVTLRARLEERFSDAADGTDLRLRTLARVGYQATSSLELALWDEGFVGLGDVAWAPSGFAENRAFVGPAWHLGGQRIEVGYMNQYVEASDATSHVVMTALFLQY